MPCNCDYMNPSDEEINASKVLCLLDELAGKKINKDSWEGYHIKAYNAEFNLNDLVQTLCSKLQNVDIAKYSLEMQMWWRDHQRADKKRIEKELKEVKHKKDKKKALSKLTPYERKLLDQ